MLWWSTRVGIQAQKDQVTDYKAYRGQDDAGTGWFIHGSYSWLKSDEGWTVKYCIRRKNSKKSVSIVAYDSLHRFECLTFWS